MVRMKLFSPELANDLIPTLEPLVQELLKKRRELAIRLLETDPALHGGTPRRSRLAGVRSSLPAPRFGGLKLQIMRLVQRIESMGCIVRDLDLGLIDFPSTRDGEPIYLCWKAGEPAVTHWHGVADGFSGRHPL
jgi:hypothetical protein